ncbi:hypothetical protein B0H14DRAFT_2678192 [Mycena olivaceomarginata]|nr:hypothetical protein B0H14DRAFT_2678192 [Mycena olivaceomarginata]
MAVAGLLLNLRSKPADNNPTHTDIETANRLQREQEERDMAAQLAKEEADRLAQEAKMNIQRARDAQAAMEAAQAEAERIRTEAEKTRVAAERAAEAERHEAQRREQGIREEARRAVEVAQQEALRQQQLAEEENRLAVEAQRAAEEAARAEVERQLREGIQPVVMPSDADLEDAKRRIGYRDGVYHFALVAGVAGSGKSSLINSLRGLRNRDAGAACDGHYRNDAACDSLPRFGPQDPFVWYDIPGAGTLQGLYVFARSSSSSTTADSHVRNLMREMGYESDDEEQDARSRAALEYAAREHFVSATRQNVRENLRGADLPEQRVYIVSNSTMLTQPREIGGVEKAKGSSTAVL